MKRALLLAALLASSACAQMQLFTYDGTTEKAAGAITDLGTVPAGDTREIRFHARNMGPGAVTLQTVKVAGQGFAIGTLPSLPYIIAPSNFVEFRVVFTASSAGSYSASVSANSVQTLLRASAVAAATVSMDGSTTALSSGASVDFGRVQKNHSNTVQFRISNTANAPVSVGLLSVSGAAYRATNAPIVPATIAPGDSIAFGIAFEPTTSGTYRGMLTVDNRTFNLTGVAFDPPFPTLNVVTTASATSATQQKLTLRFDAATEVAGNGTVALAFQPATGLKDDPAVRFVSSGARNASFTVKEGDTTIAFGAADGLMFQTGTTAGSIVFTITLAGASQQTTVTIAPAAVSVDTANAARRVSDIDVSVAGFDNTRTAGTLAFTFFDTAGRVIGPGAIRVDSTADFQKYFAGSQVGGAFLFRATFPVTGDATQIGGVEVELANSAGVTVTKRITIP
jgi:hypothetical protein